MTEQQDQEALPSAKEMTKLLWAHADTAAERALGLLGGPLSSNNLSRFLAEEGCLRYPTDITYTNECLEEHQFANPIFYAGESGQRCMLHIHPRYQDYPEAIPYLVAYMAASINYGDSADSDLCEHLGAMLVKQDREEFYTRVCQLADWRP